MHLSLHTSRLQSYLHSEPHRQKMKHSELHSELHCELHSLFLLQFSEPKHAKGRALLALLVAQLYLRKLYQVWEAGDMQPSALWFYAGVQLATVALALPALLLKKPKSA